MGGGGVSVGLRSGGALLLLIWWVGLTQVSPFRRISPWTTRFRGIYQKFESCPLSLKMSIGDQTEETAESVMSSLLGERLAKQSFVPLDSNPGDEVYKDLPQQGAVRESDGKVALYVFKDAENEVDVEWISSQEYRKYMEDGGLGMEEVQYHNYWKLDVQTLSSLGSLLESRLWKLLGSKDARLTDDHDLVTSNLSPTSLRAWSCRLTPSQVMRVLQKSGVLKVDLNEQSNAYPNVSRTITWVEGEDEIHLPSTNGEQVPYVLRGVNHLLLTLWNDEWSTLKRQQLHSIFGSPEDEDEVLDELPDDDESSLMNSEEILVSENSLRTEWDNLHRHWAHAPPPPFSIEEALVKFSDGDPAPILLNSNFEEPNWWELEFPTLTLLQATKAEALGEAKDWDIWIQTASHHPRIVEQWKKYAAPQQVHSEDTVLSLLAEKEALLWSSPESRWPELKLPENSQRRRRISSLLRSIAVDAPITFSEPYSKEATDVPGITHFLVNEMNSGLDTQSTLPIEVLRPEDPSETPPELRFADTLSLPNEEVVDFSKLPTEDSALPIPFSDDQLLLSTSEELNILPEIRKLAGWEERKKYRDELSGMSDALVKVSLSVLSPRALRRLLESPYFEVSDINLVERTVHVRPQLSGTHGEVCVEAKTPTIVTKFVKEWNAIVSKSPPRRPFELYPDTVEELERHNLTITKMSNDAEELLSPFTQEDLDRLIAEGEADPMDITLESLQAMYHIKEGFTDEEIQQLNAFSWLDAPVNVPLDPKFKPPITIFNSPGEFWSTFGEYPQWLPTAQQFMDAHDSYGNGIGTRLDEMRSNLSGKLSNEEAYVLSNIRREMESIYKYVADDNYGQENILDRELGLERFWKRVAEDPKTVKDFPSYEAVDVSLISDADRGIKYTSELLEMKNKKSLRAIRPNPYGDRVISVEELDRRVDTKLLGESITVREQYDWTPDPQYVPHIVEEDKLLRLLPLLIYLGPGCQLVSTKDNILIFNYHGWMDGIIGQQAAAEYVGRRIYPELKGLRLETPRRFDERDL